jgi:alkyl hydroperoxide reductase subunit D
MTNIYYRFTHLVANKEYEVLRASLRMNVMANPGIEKIAFEAASLAVSAINGCGNTVSVRKACKAIVRIASLIDATAVTLEQAGSSS